MQLIQFIDVQFECVKVFQAYTCESHLDTKSIGDPCPFGPSGSYRILCNISDGTRCLCLRDCTVSFDNTITRVQFS